MKVCNCCEIEKSLDDFGDEPRVKDGKRAQCKDCVTFNQHEYYLKNRQKVIDRSAKWAKDNPDKHAEHHRIAVMKHRKTNPLKTKAHDIVSNALKAGTMTRQQCKVFDCFDIGEAHHEDYSKPLDVEWLCTKHHKQLHKENNMNQYVTVRTTDHGETYESFFVNTIKYDGSTAEYGHHSYAHKRSARRAAIALAKKKEISYRQDLEYTNTPHAFIAEKATV